MGLLLDRVALVTGGTQGIGLGIALQLAQEGATVVICSRSAEKGPPALEAIEAVPGRGAYVQADVSQKQQAYGVVDQTVERFGRIDILVNNAQSTSPFIPIEEKTDEMYALTLGSGLHASIWTMMAAFPHMRAQGGGRIINFGSRRGVFGAKGSADYNAAKEAIRGLTRTAAREWGRYGILANVVAPAAESPGTAAYFAQNPEMAAKILGSIPLRRLGDPRSDIGALVVGLASDDAQFITGQTFMADGGMHLKRPE